MEDKKVIKYERYAAVGDPGKDMQFYEIMYDTEPPVLILISPIGNFYRSGGRPTNHSLLKWTLVWDNWNWKKS
jgi:hypothetical protein